MGVKWVTIAAVVTYMLTATLLLQRVKLTDTLSLQRAADNIVRHPRSSVHLMRLYTASRYEYMYNMT
eukprot:COSAG01_NODE_7055_length_3373_cov_74.243053_1_plen_67_part_00